MLYERQRRMAVLKPPGERTGLFRSLYGYLGLQWGVERPWMFPFEAARRFGISYSNRIRGLLANRRGASA